MTNNLPYQYYLDEGWFVVKEKVVSIRGNLVNYSQTYVTAKGLMKIRELWDADHNEPSLLDYV